MVSSKCLLSETNNYKRLNKGLTWISFLPVPPEMLVPLSDVTCDKGECVTLRCKVCGRPKATVTWKGPDQKTLTNNGHFSIVYRYGQTNIMSAKKKSFCLATLEICIYHVIIL